MQTKTTGLAHGLHDGCITPWSCIFLNCSATSSLAAKWVRRTGCLFGAASPVSIDIWTRSVRGTAIYSSTGGEHLLNGIAQLCILCTNPSVCRLSDKPWGRKYEGTNNLGLGLEQVTTCRPMQGETALRNYHRQAPEMAHGPQVLSCSLTNKANHKVAVSSNSPSKHYLH